MDRAQAHDHDLQARELPATQGGATVNRGGVPPAPCLVCKRQHCPEKPHFPNTFHHYNPQDRVYPLKTEFVTGLEVLRE